MGTSLKIYLLHWTKRAGISVRAGEGLFLPNNHLHTTHTHTALRVGLRVQGAGRGIPTSIYPAEYGRIAETAGDGRG